MDGLKLFESFNGVFLETRVGPDAQAKFHKLYALKTGDSPDYDNDLCHIRLKGWDGAIDGKIYFSAPDWVVESVRKLGFHVFPLTKNIHGILKAYQWNEALCDYQWGVANNELFWALVSYGYRLGKNAPIAYEFYAMNKALEALAKRPFEFVPGVKILQIEAENPTVEAMMFAEMTQTKVA